MESAAIIENQTRKQISWEDVDYNSNDFEQIGIEYENKT